MTEEYLGLYLMNWGDDGTLIPLLVADESRLLVQGAMDGLHFTGICFCNVLLCLLLPKIRWLRRDTWILEIICLLWGFNDKSAELSHASNKMFGLLELNKNSSVAILKRCILDTILVCVWNLSKKAFSDWEVDWTFYSLLSACLAYISSKIIVKESSKS